MDAHYGDQPAEVGNLYGLLVRALRGKFPRFTREEFDRQYSDAIDDALAAGERALPEVQEEVRSILAQSKILCLTELPDSNPMWAYYAEGHQGIVLRFKSVPDLDSPWCVARPVNYLADMPNLFNDDFLSDMLSGRVSLDTNTMMDRLIYTKSAEWAHEREWRIFSGSGRNPDEPYEDIPFNVSELDALILGCRMSDDDKASICELTERCYPQAQILQAEKTPEKFQFAINPV